MPRACELPERDAASEQVVELLDEGGDRRGGALLVEQLQRRLRLQVARLHLQAAPHLWCTTRYVDARHARSWYAYGVRAVAHQLPCAAGTHGTPHVQHGCPGTCTCQYGGPGTYTQHEGPGTYTCQLHVSAHTRLLRLSRLDRQVLGELRGREAIEVAHGGEARGGELELDRWRERQGRERRRHDRAREVPARAALEKFGVINRQHDEGLVDGASHTYGLADAETTYSASAASCLGFVKTPRPRSRAASRRAARRRRDSATTLLVADPPTALVLTAEGASCAARAVPSEGRPRGPLGVSRLIASRKVFRAPSESRPGTAVLTNANSASAATARGGRAVPAIWQGTAPASGGRLLRADPAGCCPAARQHPRRSGGCCAGTGQQPAAPLSGAAPRLCRCFLGSTRTAHNPSNNA
eukprot:scaffold79176_cov60-Phaeocystis_antarctica.AAC.2